MSLPGVLADVVLFAAVACLFIFMALGVGCFLRPHKPTPLKLATYECGEPTVGSSDLQFDLRFYVVALVFIVFEVELAFFFPWATIFGKFIRAERGATGGESIGMTEGVFSPERETGLAPVSAVTATDTLSASVFSSQRQSASGNLGLQFLWLAAGEVGCFLLVVLLGFFYLWYQGDLDWVRALEVLPICQETGQKGLAPPE